jgi:hypothetical protein
MVGAVVGDDAHKVRQIGRAWIMVKVPAISTEALRASLRDLAFYATTGPEVDMGAKDGTLRCAGDLTAIAFIDRQGRVRKESTGAKATYRPSGDEGFVRIEGRHASGGRIWSQPFWLEMEEDEAR